MPAVVAVHINHLSAKRKKFCGKFDFLDLLPCTFLHSPNSSGKIWNIEICQAREFQTFPWFSKISSQKSIIMILFENHIFCIFLHSCNSFQIMKSNPSQSQLNRLAKANHHQAQFKVRNISLEKKPLKLFFFRTALKNQSLDFWVCPTQILMEMRLQ